ncbi:uncharacterized protein LOC135349057 [Halichondria panicea]|uniref:uncharacterized protein LOC135349057 n=1 Tax=Halichondria panicea TaxID=6063 RepID=UPI00312BBC4C
MDCAKPAGIFQFSVVDELIHQSEEEFKPVPFPFELPKFEGTVNFGAEMKAKHFYLNESWTFLNHGAFGSAIKEGLKSSEMWREYCEQQPLKFMDREVFQHLIHGLRKLARFVDADPADIVFVQNATTGINAVVRSLVKKFQPGDSILMIDVAYGTVKLVIEDATRGTGITINEIKLPIPVTSPQEIVKLIEKSLQPSTKLAVLDHIPSNLAFIMPIKKLVDVCHERGVQVLVDGAHCLGSMKISMRELGADYYAANGHKWLCSPKGTAFLYVARSHQHMIHPPVISWGFGHGFTSEFSWIASMDYTPYLSFLTVLDFWDHYGQDKMIKYMYDTSKEAGQLLCEAWQTSLVADISMCGPMAVVKLPEGVVPHSANLSPPYSDPAAHAVMNILHFQYKIEVPVRVINGELYVRISAHVYNELGEFKVLADAILAIVKNNRTTQ